METRLIAVADLRFDRKNPRLPKDLIDGEPEDLALFYYEQAVVADLVGSMLENGFFPHEPIIVRPDGEGVFTVVEGNRRLTALLVIHGLPDARKIGAGNIQPTEDQLQKLEKIPCVIAEDRKQIRKFIGYRHISGPRTWDPDAKARFVVEELEETRSSGDENPFKTVAASLGSNLQTVRNDYVALKLLERANDEASFDTSQVLTGRFGVWLRLMSSPDFRQFVGFNISTDIDTVDEGIGQCDLGKLTEVLKDLTHQRGEQPILADSRDATAYGRVLSNTVAYNTLRSTKDLSAAKMIVEQGNLPSKIQSQTRKLNALTEEVKAAEFDPEIEDAAKLLVHASRVMFKMSQPDPTDDLFPES